MDPQPLQMDPESVIKSKMTEYISLYGLFVDPLVKLSIAEQTLILLNALINKSEKTQKDEDLKKRIEDLWKKHEDAILDYYDREADPNWKDTWLHATEIMRECVDIALRYGFISPKVFAIDPSTLNRMLDGIGWRR